MAFLWFTLEKYDNIYQVISLNKIIFLPFLIFQKIPFMFAQQEVLNRP